MPDATDPADTVAALALTVPGVAALHPGMFGEVATYLPGRRVAGVRVRDDAVDIHVALWHTAPIRDTAAAVRAAVSAALPGRTVNVTVEDVTDRPAAR